MIWGQLDIFNLNKVGLNSILYPVKNIIPNITCLLVAYILISKVLSYQYFISILIIITFTIMPKAFSVP